MKISKKGIALIKEFEGFRSNAYIDAVGIWTIGYGTIKVNGRPVVKGMTCTEEQAVTWLEEEVNDKIIPWLKANVKVTLTQGKIDALSSFCYNLGCGALGKSTLLKKLNNGNYDEAANEFTKWVYAGGDVLPGLVKRRNKEKQVFLSGRYV